jgi:hypothetical protein
MMRQIAVLAALLLMAGDHARAENEPKAITLACDGTMTTMEADSKPEPANRMGVVVNLVENTVSFGAYVVKIDAVGAANITFSGESKVQLSGVLGKPAVTVSIMGDLDRVTGHLTATQFSPAMTFNFDLICKPAGRLF